MMRTGAGAELQAAHVNVTSIGTEGGVGSFVVWDCYVMVIVVVVWIS